MRTDTTNTIQNSLSACSEKLCRLTQTLSGCRLTRSSRSFTASFHCWLFYCTGFQYCKCNKNKI